MTWRMAFINVQGYVCGGWPAGSIVSFAEVASMRHGPLSNFACLANLLLLPILSDHE